MCSIKNHKENFTTIMEIIKKKKGFTLAEVLITLGIIGIVAAITIPTIYANVIGIKYRSQFKKTISSLDQAVRLNKANYDWDFSDIDQPCGGIDFMKHTADNHMSVCAIFNSNLAGIIGYYREFKLANDYGYKFNGQTIGVSLGGGQYTIYQLATGAFVGFRSISFSKGCTLGIDKKLNANTIAHCTGFIDVNGLSLPNEEIKCSVGRTSMNLDDECVVKSKDMKDVYPIVFHDAIVEPATNAAKYVLETTK